MASLNRCAFNQLCVIPSATRMAAMSARPKQSIILDVLNETASPFNSSSAQSNMYLSSRNSTGRIEGKYGFMEISGRMSCARKVRKASVYLASARTSEVGYYHPPGQHFLWSRYFPFVESSYRGIVDKIVLLGEQKAMVQKDLSDCRIERV